MTITVESAGEGQGLLSRKKTLKLLSPVPHQQERRPGDQVPWTWVMEETQIPDDQVRRLPTCGTAYVLIVPEEDIVQKFNMDYRVTLPVLKYARRLLEKHLYAAARKQAQNSPATEDEEVPCLFY